MTASFGVFRCAAHISEGLGLLFKKYISVKSFLQFLPLIIKHLFSSSALFFDFGSSFSNQTTATSSAVHRGLPEEQQN